MTNLEPAEKPATVAAQATHVAPKKAPAKKRASQKKGAAIERKTAKAAKRKKAANPAPTKGATILRLVRRAKGASLATIMNATGWQAHSVRGFLSIARKKHGLKIESVENNGKRLYRVAKGKGK
jgi:hypothetical protein